MACLSVCFGKKGGSDHSGEGVQSEHEDDGKSEDEDDDGRVIVVNPSGLEDEATQESNLATYPDEDSDSSEDSSEFSAWDMDSPGGRHTKQIIRRIRWKCSFNYDSDS